MLSSTKPNSNGAFLQAFYDPAFEPLQAKSTRSPKSPGTAYDEYRKSPRVTKAGPGFADPDYDLSVEWLATRANPGRRTPAEKPQVAAAHPDHQWLIAQRPHLSRRNVEDLSAGDAGAKSVREDARLRSRSARPFAADVAIRPQDLSCKACVSTAQPLCHWPCSCYPNHAIGQTGDWMNEIYPKWVGRAWRDDRRAGELVPGAVLAQADDRPPGLRRRRQSRSDLDPRQGRRAKPRRSNSKAGPTRAISPAACSRSSCMAMQPAPKISAESSLTG